MGSEQTVAVPDTFLGKGVARESNPDLRRTLPCALCHMTHFVSVIIHFCVVKAIAVSIEELLEQVQGDRQSLRGEGKGLLGLEVRDGRQDSIHTHPPDW